MEIFFKIVQVDFWIIIRGLATASAIFLIYAALQFKDTLFVRPHPVIWRIVNGVGILYLMLLVFMLFQVKFDPV